MAGYLEVCESIAIDVASGRLAPGVRLPTVRVLAREQGTAVATVVRAVAELGRAGVVVTEPRRSARVAPSGAVHARRLLHGGRALRLAGSDDPALDLLLARVGEDVERATARGSFAGLAALWNGSAEAATLHLAHVDGSHNAPYAARVLAGRQPALVRLWRREQGIVVPPGNPDGIESVADLARVTVAHRSPGTGTRALLERLLWQGGVDPARVKGPEVGSHLEVAFAVASGLARAGVAVRAAATLAGLELVPIAWEAFDLALPADSLDAAAPLLDALGDPAVTARIGALEGYELDGTGAIVLLA